MADVTGMAAVEDVIARLDMAVEASDRRKAALDKRLASEVLEEESGKVDLELLEVLRDVRQDGLEKLARARERAAVRIHKMRLDRAPKGAEWAEAAARASFVRADIAAADPGDLPGHYRVLAASGDSVGAWLMGRYGLEHLEALGAETGPAAGKARAAARELAELMLGDVIRAEQEAAERLRDLERRLTEPRGPEEFRRREQVAIRYGIRQ